MGDMSIQKSDVSEIKHCFVIELLIWVNIYIKLFYYKHMIHDIISIISKDLIGCIKKYIGNV